MKFKKWQILFVFLFSIAANTSAENPDINTVVRKIDQLYRSKTSYALLTMEIVTPNWSRTLTLKAWTRGTKNTFIRILTPEKERNVATLRIGNQMWNFLPNANKTIKIPPSMMMSSWMGSDFTNDDLVKESSMLDDYTFRYVRPPDKQPDILYIEFNPKEDKPIVWGRIVAAVRSGDYLPVWQKYYDEKDALMRVMTFRKIKTFSGREIPTTMELVPQKKPGNKTVIIYNDVAFDIPLSETVFTERNLRARE